MTEYNGDSHYGRFVGAQYDLNESVRHQDEVILIVRARVSEKTFRTTRNGTTREISVMKPEEVIIVDDARRQQVQELFDMNNSDLTPKVGTPVLVPVPSIRVDIEDEPEETASIASSESDSRRVVASIGAPRDKMLARFLSTVDES